MNKKSVTTRYPADLHAALKKRAEANGRSFNAEVVYELSQYQTSSEPRQYRKALSEQDIQPTTELTIEHIWKRYATTK